MRLSGTAVVAGEASGGELGLSRGWTGVVDGRGLRSASDGLDWTASRGGGSGDRAAGYGKGVGEEDEEEVVVDGALATVTSVLDGTARRDAKRGHGRRRRRQQPASLTKQRPGTRGTLDPSQKLSNNSRYRLVERLMTRNTHRITTLDHADDPAIPLNARILREDPAMDDDGWDRCCVYNAHALGKPKHFHGNPMQSLLG